MDLSSIKPSSKGTKLLFQVVKAIINPAAINVIFFGLLSIILITVGTIVDIVDSILRFQKRKTGGSGGKMIHVEVWSQMFARRN